MKKVLPLLLMLLILVPFTNAEAAEFDATRDYLEYMNIDTKIYPWAGTKRVGHKQPQETVTIIFPDTINITGFRVEGGGANASGTLQFLDKNRNTISTHNFANPFPNGNGKITRNISGINGVTVQKNGSGEFNMMALEIYGDIVESGFQSISVLTETHTHDSVTLSWEKPKDSVGTIIKKDGVEIANLANTHTSYNIKNLTPNTSYKFEVFAKYPEGDLSIPKSISVTTDPIPPDTKPPANISTVAVTESSSTIKFDYIYPSDEDFSRLMIFKNGELIETEYKSTTYTATGLTPNTSYTFKFVSVDTSGNTSSGYIQTVVTNVERDELPPIAPSGVVLTTGNQSGKLSWDKNTESDLKGYNVYVNGVKNNAALLLTNNYIITGLENDATYLITVTAVDTSGNESPMSLAQTLTPSKNSMPIFKTDYDLKFVADGTSSWFLALWPILAFAVGIPLAFYISNRIKSMFFA